MKGGCWVRLAQAVGYLDNHKQDFDRYPESKYVGIAKGSSYANSRQLLRKNVDQSIIVSPISSLVDRNKTDRDVIFPVLKSQCSLGINTRQLFLFRQRISICFSQKGMNCLLNLLLQNFAHKNLLAKKHRSREPS